MVPADVYPTARAAFTASSIICWRRPSSTSSSGLGLSSIIFWWLRCTEQSRSPSATTLPWLSAMICTSTWRGFCTARSRYMVLSPKPLTDSRWAMLNMSAKSSSDSDTRMPLPPPPDDALIMMGQPMSFACSKASSTSCRPFLVPGTTGTPASIMVRRAWLLLPMRSMTSGVGPMNTMSLSRQSFAKVEFSERKP